MRDSGTEGAGRVKRRVTDLSRARLVRSTLGLGFSRIVAGVMVFSSSVVVAREAGATALGIFGLASAVGLYASSLADAGTSIYLVPELGRAPRRDWSAVWSDASRFELRSAVPFSVVYAVSVAVLTSGTERWALLAALPWWLLLRLNLALRAVFTAAERVGPDALGTIFESVVALAIVATAIVVTHSVAISTLGLAAGALVGTGIRLRALTSLGVHPVRPLLTATAFVRHTLPYAAVMTLQVVYLRIDILLLAVLASTRDLGLYQPAVRFAAAAVILPDAITSVVLGRSARSPEDPGFKRRQEQLLTAGVVIGVVVVLILAITGKSLLGIVFGDEFRHAWVALVLLAATPSLTFIAAMNGTALTARGMQSERALCLAAAALVAVVAGIPAVAIWSYNGAAAVSVLNELVLTSAYAVALATKVGRHAVLTPRLASFTSHRYRC